MFAGYYCHLQRLGVPKNDMISSCCLPMFEHAMGDDSKKTPFLVVLEPLIGKV